MSIQMAFRLGSLQMAVPADTVIHVEACSRITPSPAGPEWLVGAVLCQGRILPVIDPARLLEIEQLVGPRAGGAWLICVRTSKGLVAWTIDSEPVITQDIVLQEPGSLDDLLSGLARTLLIDPLLISRFMDSGLQSESSAQARKPVGARGP